MKAGWQKHRIADVAEKITDGSHNPPKGIPHSEFMMLSSKNIFDDDLHYADPRYLTAEHFEQENKRTGILPRDVLLTIVGTIGRCAVVPSDAPNITLQRSVAVIRPRHSLVDSRFLMYSFIERCEELNEQARGVAQKGIYLETLRQLDVALPSLPEQQRIVAILDEAFDGIATAKVNAEKNLQNARALFESHLQSVFTERGEGWVEKEFEEVCNKITDGTHHSPKTQFSKRGPGTFPYITSKNIRNNYMDLSNVAYIERVFHDEVYARCQPELGDVLLTKDGAGTGNVTLNTLDEPFSLLSSVCLIKTNRNLLKPAFLCYYLQSSTGLSSIVGQMTGAAIKRIVLKDIKRATIPFPSINEQYRIVSTLNSLLAKTQRLESLYQQKLTALDDLKRSLLHQAFSGAL